MSQLTVLQLFSVQLLDGAWGTLELLAVLPQLPQLGELDLEGTIKHLPVHG